MSEKYFEILFFEYVIGLQNQILIIRSPILEASTGGDFFHHIPFGWDASEWAFYGRQLEKLGDKTVVTISYNKTPMMVDFLDAYRKCQIFDSNPSQAALDQLPEFENDHFVNLLCEFLETYGV